MEVHTCSYKCIRPGCAIAQRDFLYAKYLEVLAEREVLADLVEELREEIASMQRPTI